MSGYCDCACRDCFNVAIGEAGKALCAPCREAGCEAGGDHECRAPDAYGSADPVLASVLASIRPTDPVDKPAGCPCSGCGASGGRKVEWTIAGERKVLCRCCYYAAEARANPVDALFRRAGYEVADTAGGCNAYRRTLPDGRYVLITGLDEGGDATNIPERADTACVVGCYSADGDALSDSEHPSVPAALAAAEAL